MASPLIISVSGLRGEIGVTLTPEVAIRYALVYSKATVSDAAFVIAHDGRKSGEIFADAICSALNAIGRDVYYAGVAATPTVGVLVRSLKAAGGIQISASHNPKNFNGLKLFSSEGRVIPKREGSAILKSYKEVESAQSWNPGWKDVDNIGKRIPVSDSTIAHLNLVLSTVDVDLIRSKKFRVLLDSNNASGSILGKRLLEALGCEVYINGATPNGDFLHTPEPTEENLQSVLQSVVKAGACVGFCQDPDADRLALIDERGLYIGEEYTTAICSKNRLQKLQLVGANTSFNLVVNCASSRMTYEIASEFGGTCFRSPVGEANVVDLMKEKNAIYGGEGNGGPIDPTVGFVRDSFVGMAQVLEMMARNSQPLSKIAAGIKGYSIVKRKIALPEGNFQSIVDFLCEQYACQEKNLEDGIRIDWSDKWVLVRPSNTEPIARIIAEAPTLSQACELCDQVQELIDNRK